MSGHQLTVITAVTGGGAMAKAMIVALAFVFLLVFVFCIGVLKVTLIHYFYGMGVLMAGTAFFMGLFYSLDAVKKAFSVYHQV